ncbi:hypothetical protein MNAN1_001171 [Malassezia nana]|uniref:E3 ubiquitin-protein ligase DMA2 n=1 Tax=Malassezia nana TaxID=180528 RepID=A0AAF0EIE2_9BASI|nr:hypothetical protein MNAN1_001171 [Malassezia nana]
MVDRSATSAQSTAPGSTQGVRPARRLSNLLRRYSFSQPSQTLTDTVTTSSRSGQGSNGSHLLSTSAGSATSGTGRLISPLRAAAQALSHRSQSFDMGSTPSREARTRMAPSPIPNGASSERGRVHKVRLAPYVEATRSLVFFPADLELVEGGPHVQIGRFSDRSSPMAPRTSSSQSAGPIPMTGLRANDETTETSVSESAPEPGSQRQPVMIMDNKTCVAFQSKVVSRLHAEIWCGEGGKIYLRDTKSSSGTFVNRLRLSAPGTLSRAHEVKDGDLVQFGIDYQGGSEDQFRAIKVRIEIDRDRSIRPTAYAQNMLQQLQMGPKSSTEPATKTSMMDECCICLLKMRVCQALFIAPCSHMFHFKCIRPILTLHYPGFSCPLCRAFADLEADLQDDTDEEPEEIKVPVPPITTDKDPGPSTQEPVPVSRFEPQSARQPDPSPPVSPSAELSDASDAMAIFSTPLLPAAELDSSPMTRSDVHGVMHPGSSFIPTGISHQDTAPESSPAPDMAPPLHGPPTSAPPLFWRTRALSS